MFKFLAPLLLVLSLTACGESYDFEADPEGFDVEDGNRYEGDPRTIQCFIIEADGNSDSGDIQLGKFCKE